MWPFKKKNKIIITAVVAYDYAYAAEYTAIHRTGIPTWFKSCPRGRTEYKHGQLDETRTVRGCMGITEQLRTGFELDLWSELIIHSHEQDLWQYKFADNQSRLDFHDPIQIPNFMPTMLKCKLYSPWLLLTDKPLRYLIMDSFWQFPDTRPWIRPPGIVEFDGVASTNQFILIENTPSELRLNQGTTLSQIIPITDMNYELRVDTISNAEFHRYSQLLTRTSFDQWGMKLARMIKRRANTPL